MDIFETRLRTIIDGDGPNHTWVSIVPSGAPESDMDHPEGVELVIGAQWRDRAAHRFTKNDLAELIDILQDVHDAL